MIRPIEDGFYEIISGERRYSALKSLVDKGDNKYSKVPCKIVNLNDVDSEITLIQANAQTRELSDADKLKQIERLTELYKEKKKNGEKVTNIRKLVSKDIGLSEGQVAKYSTVSNNLIPELRTILDDATDRWGCKIDRVEIKDITPPADIRDAMEKQMNAERNKRALILEAEADKEAKIRRAAGEAQAIKEVAEAKAKEIAMVYDAIKTADPDEKLVQIKSLEALEEIAKGDANKVFIPFEATSALSSLGAVKEVFKDDKK